MRNQAYNLFSRRIHKKAKKKHFPLRAMFEITYRCNFNCLHCYVPESLRKESEERELKTKEVFLVLDQLNDAGCLYVGFTGGEPFVRNDFLEILRYAKIKGFEIIIYTNGSLINGSVADALKELRLNKIDITVNSLRKEPFEKITQTQDSYEKVFRTIELLNKRNIPLGFKSCLLKENEDEIENIKEFARSHNALHRLDTMLFPQLNGEREPYGYRGSMKEVIRLPGYQVTQKDNFADCSLNSQKAEPNNQYSIPNTLFKCDVGISQAAITPYGELKMCLMIDYPRYGILGKEDTRTQGHKDTSVTNGLKEAWQKLSRFVSEIKPDETYQCDRCKLYGYCKWCPARSWLENGGFSSCVSESKERAEYNRLRAEENLNFAAKV
jgi:radical SAM protein with 4Fe4S-binding SPASM domain